MKPKAGDKVKITTSEGEFEGRLLPRPELMEQDITILKLKTGYNIGIENKKIKKITITEEYKTPVIKAQKIKEKKELPTIAILSTGGTISSRIDYRTGGVYADYTAEDFIAMCPELQEVANVKAKKIMSVMSEDAMPENWVQMAEEVLKVINEVEGVVITHGTDTMHFTSSALSFLLKDLNKPVIITGAQRSIDRGSSDAFMNLICAVNAAAKWDGAEVAICMHATSSDNYCNLIGGTKARKMHTSRRDAFRAINDKPLARVYPDGKIETTNEYAKRNKNKPTQREIDPKVAIIYVYPGMEPDIIEYHLKHKVHGIVIAATALGHVPTNNPKSLIPAIKKAAKKIPIVICSQTIYGRVHPYVYTNLRRVSIEAGALYLEDMLPETAYTKLMIALKQENPKEFM
ncbi:Glu-tRNA(Gln) amidotransferase subunit GatD, partial [Candidatus Woesearchaeota archaeon]|nr:Glu-tRNA(Gln) amidotransferase subunit GatD [Candidatus Woesearchaeota archaeon]